MSYANYRGELMPLSAAPRTTVNGTAAGGETLTAAPGPSAVDPGEGLGDLMIGAAGDNIFYVRDRTDMVQVQGGLAGVKSVVAFAPFTLPANVHNLESAGRFNYAVGNDLPNLIVGKTGRQSLYGARGDDVLVGAGDETSFIVAAGEGNDVIYGFTSTDTVRLIGSSFRSFADVRGAMRQQGSDVVVQINGSETLTIRDASVNQFGERNFLLPLDRAKLGGVTFSDDFNSLQLWNGSTGTGNWLPNFGSDPTKHEAYALPQNGEQQVYTTPEFTGTGSRPLGYNPFSVNNGILTITAQELRPEDKAVAFGANYSSGLLITRGIFEQKYGYFEICMSMPLNAPGAWPAFWMVPDPNGRGVEADVGENISIDAQVDHIRGYADGQVVAYAEALKTGDPAGLHTYGMMWTPTKLTFYYDETAVYSIATPAGWTEPMYMLVNMAVGGYGGQPQSSAFPASMQVDFVRAYALADGSSIVERGQPPGAFGTAGDDRLTARAGAQTEGLAGADTLTGVNARNTMLGGDGNDSITGGTDFNQVNGNKGEDTVIGKSLVGDWLLGGQGNDLIDALASSGRNILNGNIGADTVTGGTGADTLRGGQDNDLIRGAGGDDWISGDRGFDTVRGGAGADTFHHFAGAGVTTIQDFDRAEGDRVLLSGGAQYSTAQQGADVLVNLSGGGQLILQNTQLSSLGSGWIAVV